jgi:hypothetical protein
MALKGFIFLTVFFFARSPEAPRTMMTVLSFNSMDLVGQNEISKGPFEQQM